ncbi:MAG: sterol desaturase family protein [Myxococcota bacterium]|jgi:sterol desaturase/sphingolipid hydroxylase (fatty acid hydroxylase superfamily)
MGPNLVGLAIPGFFAGILVELGVAKLKGRKVYRLGDAMGDMGCGIAQQLVGLLFATAAMTGAYEWLYGHRLWTLPTTWLPWVAALVGVEVAYYWWHRLSHEVNLLWAAHVVHHHSEDYNLAVALRQSVTTWATSLPFYLPLAWLGVPTFHFAVVLALTTLYQFWIHTELVPPLGFLEKWINTPALHRVHHAINPRYLDKNHAATFSVLDRLFGTWQPEEEPCVYGTTRPINSFNPLWAQVETYVDLVRLAAKAPSVGQALKVFFASPAWRPAWMGEAEKRDFARKYQPAASAGVRAYAFAQWVLLLGGVFSFLMWGRALGPAPFWAAVGLIALSLASLPSLVEGKRWARPLEGLRLVAVAALVPLLLA